MTKVLAAITGASGARYGVKLVQRLLDEEIDVECIVSSAARRVLAIEGDLTGEPSDWLVGASEGVTGPASE